MQKFNFFVGHFTEFAQSQTAFTQIYKRGVSVYDSMNETDIANSQLWHITAAVITFVISNNFAKKKREKLWIYRVLLPTTDIYISRTDTDCQSLTVCASTTRPLTTFHNLCWVIHDFCLFLLLNSWYQIFTLINSTSISYSNSVRGFYFLTVTDLVTCLCPSQPINNYQSINYFCLVLNM